MKGWYWFISGMLAGYVVGIIMLTVWWLPGHDDAIRGNLVAKQIEHAAAYGGGTVFLPSGRFLVIGGNAPIPPTASVSSGTSPAP